MKEKLSNIIQGVITSNDFIEEGLSHDYINLTKFSEYLLPILQEQNQKSELSATAIKMALSRSKKIFLLLK